MVVAEIEEVTEGYGLLIRELEAYFYADDGLVASTQLERMKWAFNGLTGLFSRLILRKINRKW